MICWSALSQVLASRSAAPSPYQVRFMSGTEIPYASTRTCTTCCKSTSHHPSPSVPCNRDAMSGPDTGYAATRHLSDLACSSTLWVPLFQVLHAILLRAGFALSGPDTHAAVQTGALHHQTELLAHPGVEARTRTPPEL
eukprot:262791-Rhodomonas_salina.3